MKLSIFTTITKPYQRGDNARDAISCYIDLANELVIVNGRKDEIKNNKQKNVKKIYYEWPKEFNWPFIGEQFQRGYEVCTGDWVIHADLDFIFHEKDFEAIRKACEDNPEAPALSFYKYQFIQPDRYNLKSRLVIAVNKVKYGDRIRFDSGGDLCQPSLDGKYISPNDIPEARIPFYNYEKLTKTKEQIMDDCGRMERAYKRHFGKYQFKESDGTDEKAYEGWFRMAKGRYSKPQTPFNFDDHPKYVKETIKNLKPNQWGYSGFGELR